VFTRLDPPHSDDVLLVTMELLANAYDHGGGPDRVRLTWHPAPCAVRVSVDDREDGRPRVVHASADAVRGRGMLLVAGLAADWSVRDYPGGLGKTVWAVVECAGTGRIRCRTARSTVTDP
jgi:anti-sigma regulatory factor (Ser/Thr protein kinase)